MVRSAPLLGPLQGEQPTLPAPARRTRRVPAQPRALALASDRRSSLAVHLLAPGRLLAADAPSTSPYTANALLPMSVPQIPREPGATGTSLREKDAVWGLRWHRADEWIAVTRPGPPSAQGGDLGAMLLGDIRHGHRILVDIQAAKECARRRHG